MPVPALMKLLGHKTPKMTMRYVEVAEVDVRQAYDQALVQLRLIHTVQARSLPVPSVTPQQPASPQLLKLMEAMISYLESLRGEPPNLAFGKWPAVHPNVVQSALEPMLVRWAVTAPNTDLTIIQMRVLAKFTTRHLDSVFVQNDLAIFADDGHVMPVAALICDLAFFGDVE